MGLPDSYHTLQPGQVFVLLPESLGRQVLQGPVLVTRNPIIHPSDIRRLTAVRNQKLSQLYKNSVGGCIVFATQGDRSAADEMSGGDFDGDTYLVIYKNDELMETFQPIAVPFDYTLQPESTPAAPNRSAPPTSATRSNPTHTGRRQTAPLTPAKPAPPVYVASSSRYVLDPPLAMSITQELELEDVIRDEIKALAGPVPMPVTPKTILKPVAVTPTTVDPISFAILKDESFFLNKF